MNRRILFLFLFLLPFLAGAEVNPPLMPLPKKISTSAGALRIDTKFRVGFASEPEGRMERAAQRMIKQLSLQTGMPLQTSIADARTATLVIDCQEAVDRPDTLGQSEAYRLDVTPTRARLRSATVVGALRGLQTFLQLIVPGDGGFIAPAVQIEDEPRFQWRGLLIDVTSHFMPVPVIERNLDAMEAVKLNVFHWHFTDDQGWRVESRRYPKLHQLGSGGDYYTQDEIRHLLAYAHDRGIRIIPEFDMPGHSATWLIGYPELASAPGPYSIIRTFGIYDPVLDPTKEGVYQFIDGLIGEMAALFPDPYFHIGGDEVNGKQWKANPSIQAFIREHNLKDEAGLQTYFNQRVEVLVKKHGKTMMGWDEVLHPDLPKDIVVESWRDRESMVKAARSGHRVLLSWGYYLDHLDSAAKHYEVDPLGGPAQDLTPAEAARVLGGEACIWTEYTSPETIDSRIWPKTAAIAERFWSPAGAKDRASMYQRLDRVSDWLGWRGVLHQSNYSAMLQRLAPDAPLAALKTLGDAVEPLGIDGREGKHAYNQETPLNRLVDAARAESVPVRRLEERISRYVASRSQEDEAAIRRELERWRDNNARLRTALKSSFLLKEAAPLSEDLSRLGEIGLEALDSLRAHHTVADDWVKSRVEALDRMEKPRVEVLLAAVRPVRLLVKGAAQPRRVTAISHRGEHLNHPENTIPAFEEAIRLGADFIEVDVRTTSDGKLVLSHDATIDRCTNGHGKIAGMTFEQVRALDAGVKFGPRFAGTRIPTFDEVLELARGRIGIYVDVKSVSARDLVSHLENHGMAGHVVVYCGFDFARQIRELNPEITVMPEADNMQNASMLIERLHPKVIAFGAEDFQPGVIAAAKHANAKVYVDRIGSTDTPEGWQSAIDAGADGIQTDRPGPLVEYLRMKGYR